MEVDDKNKIVFLDLSSQCVGYTIAEFDPIETATITDAGIIKFGKMTNPQKYNIMYRTVSDIWWTSSISFLCLEQFMFNFKQRMGSLVVPEMIGAVKAACYANFPEITIMDVYPQSWKKSVTGKGRATKEEVEAVIRNRFPNKFPDKIENPVTKKQVKVPSDLFDSVSMCLWFFTEKYPIKNIEFNAEIK